MARYQYRLAGEFDWFSNSGNALLAISNPIGSGKKLTIGRFEVTPLSTTTGATAAAAAATQVTWARATVADGDAVPLVPHDAAAAPWPSTVRVVRRASVVSPGIALGRVGVLKQLTNGSSWLAMRRPFGVGRLVRAPRLGATGVEGHTVRAGESLALFADTMNSSVPLRVTATLTRVGSPSRTWSTSFFTSVIAAGQAVFAIENQAGSGEAIVVRSVSVEEVGTFDSPYFQLVPVGSIEAANLADELLNRSTSIMAMDSAYPSPSSWIRAYANVVVYPFNMPENAFADASTGSPKGFNYLKTKDFLGPVYRTLFPEQVRVGAVGNDYLGHGVSHRAADLMMRRAGITIREGEAIALVSGAETAAGATAAVGCAGWSSFHIAAQITVEPKIEPTLSITGLKNPTEVRVFAGGTTTQVAGQESVTTGTFTWTFDPEETPTVDIALLSLSYQNVRLVGIPLSLADVSIPVQQQPDRQYQNA